jgi:hypothetical protein
MGTSSISSSARSERLAAGVLLTGAIVAAISGTDERRVRLGPLQVESTCPIRLATGRRCPGCGMTRAVALLLRGKPWRATRTHPAAIPLLAMLAYRLRGAKPFHRSPAAPA